VIRDLAQQFGHDLRFVFHHLPLDDVHDHAGLAAEAAGAQGQFWEMHDLLYAHQDALAPEDLVAYSAQLGLDTRRFRNDLETRRHALRVERDVESAEESGVAGTPTFFINRMRKSLPVTA
jgi:protein-disulfide isomerase